ncbi:hypothetical protein L7358_000864 [Escherichia coli]|nr:hypothetical protein [Escherichia coli]
MTDSINANVVVSMPSQLFTMARSFKAVANGKIYIGKIDTDPVNPENQIQVYVENEDGSHVPVSQPIIINAAGYPVYNGQIAKFVTVQGHSMAVYDAYGSQQFYFPNVLKYDPDQFSKLIEGTGGADFIDGGRLTLYKKHGTFEVGGIVSNKYQGMLYSDGFYYVKTGGELPYTVTPKTSPDNNWSCVGLLNQYPLYSPENFGYIDGDDAVTSFQLAFDNMPYGGVFELVSGSVYTFKSQPAKIKKTGTYRGYGTFHTGPVYSHHAQIINNTNSPVFIIEPYYNIPDAKAYGDQNRIIEGFKVSGDKTVYPQSGFLAGQASQNTNVIQHNHVRNMGYGVCALTSYGMVIQHNVFVSNTAGVTANPATFQPQGPADLGQEGTELWQTNAIEIISNYFSGNAKAIDFNCPGNQLTILRNVIEGNDVGIHVSSMVGYAAGDDGTSLVAVTINDNYMEKNPSSHIIIGRSASGTGTVGSGPVNIQCINNQLNNAGIPDDSAAVLIYAATNAVIRNSCRNRPTSQLIYYFGGAQLSGVRVMLSANETHAGYMATGKSNILEFIDINSVRGSGSLSKLYVNPDHASVIAAGQELQWYSGLSNHPFGSYSAAVTFIREMSSEYFKAGISAVEIACAGNVGPLTNPPGFVSNITLSVISGTPVITGAVLSGVSVSISGAFSITNEGYPTSTTPFQVLRSALTITGCTFNYTGQPGGTYLLYANQASTVNLVNCSASSQLPLGSDGSIILMSSSGLTGSQTKIRGGQFFS